MLISIAGVVVVAIIAVAAVVTLRSINWASRPFLLGPSADGNGASLVRLAARHPRRTADGTRLVPADGAPLVPADGTRLVPADGTRLVPADGSFNMVKSSGWEPVDAAPGGQAPAGVNSVPSPAWSGSASPRAGRPARA